MSAKIAARSFRAMPIQHASLWRKIRQRSQYFRATFCGMFRLKQHQQGFWR
jgi:hypothetical protein